MRSVVLDSRFVFKNYGWDRLFHELSMSKTMCLIVSCLFRASSLTEH